MIETVFYMTVLSNFVRGYDKYRRVYAKAGVPESRFPDRFFVLRADELNIGVRKAEPLLARLALQGNRLIALRALVPSDALLPNERNGLGRVWPHGKLPLDGVCDIVPHEGGWRAVPVLLEDAAADSMRLLRNELLEYDMLRPRTVSLLPIARSCQAGCPFCFSDAS